MTCVDIAPRASHPPKWGGWGRTPGATEVTGADAALGDGRAIPLPEPPRQCVGPRTG